MSNQNVTWGSKTTSYSSGVRHGIEDTTEGKNTQKKINTAQVMFGKTGDLRFLPYTGDAPSGEESMNLIKNSGKKWGGKKTKRVHKKTKRVHKKTKRAHKKKIHIKH